MSAKGFSHSPRGSNSLGREEWPPDDVVWGKKRREGAIRAKNKGLFSVGWGL